MSSPELVEQLQLELEACLSELTKKDHDLKLAAEIGQSLVVANQALGDENARLQAASLSAGSLAAKLETLESTHQDFLAEYESVKRENLALAELTKTLKEQCKKSSDSSDAYLADLDECQSQIKTVNTEKDQAVAANVQLTKRSNELEEEVSNLKRQLELARKGAAGLEQQVGELSQRSSDLQDYLLSQETENADLKTRLSEMEKLLDSYQTYREQFYEQSATIEQLNSELEWSRESNSKLAARLTAVGQDSSQEDGGGKTLLNEIEDRRQELIREHEDLAEKHAGLAQSHSLSLFRQQKLKHHIARLSQLSTADNGDKTRMLEEALAQCQSEKMELEKRIDALQSRRTVSHSQWEDQLPFHADTPQLENMEFRIQQLLEECETFKRANQTLRLVKAAETDKLHQVNRLLLEKDREIDNLKKLVANSRFQLDELMLRSQEAPEDKCPSADVPDDTPPADLSDRDALQHHTDEAKSESGETVVETSVVAPSDLAPLKARSSSAGMNRKTIKKPHNSASLEEVMHQSAAEAIAPASGWARESLGSRPPPPKAFALGGENGKGGKLVVRIARPNTVDSDDEAESSKLKPAASIAEKQAANSHPFTLSHYSTEAWKKPLDPAYFTGNSTFYSFLGEANHLIKKHNLDFNGRPENTNASWLTKTSMINELSLRLTDETYADFVNRLNLLHSIQGNWAGFDDVDPQVKEFLQQFVPAGKRLEKADPEIIELDEFSRSLTAASRKKCRAQAWVLPGTGLIYVNGLSMSKYFSDILSREKIVRPFEVTGTLGSFNVWASVSGGGLKEGLLTIDRRQVERKKTGQLKARKKITWVKR
ncbi:37S ribosomal protein S9, mitochondrial [Kappamyces sp. JEL0680]|nr:37S ribosomal protein S9, mitochondrial [Kappamyces sp. JEL0680]